MWCQQRSEFAGFARYGYARSQHKFIWGMRLARPTDARGLPLGYTIVPANEHEYEPLADLLTVPALRRLFAKQTTPSLGRGPGTGCQSVVERPTVGPIFGRGAGALACASVRIRNRSTAAGPRSAQATAAARPLRCEEENRRTESRSLTGIGMRWIAASSFAGTC